MKNTIASSSSVARTQRALKLSSGTKFVRGAVVISCKFCNNTFSAAPRDAVCLKCKRPANISLSWPDKLLSLLLFPFGLLRAGLLRSSQPYAASQALALSLLSAGAWSAFYLLVVR